MEWMYRRHPGTKLHEGSIVISDSERGLQTATPFDNSTMAGMLLALHQLLQGLPEAALTITKVLPAAPGREEQRFSHQIDPALVAEMRADLTRAEQLFAPIEYRGEKDASH
jgi:hypothetical protein